MGAVSQIAWTHSTLNWWIGCTMFAAECAHCYAMTLDEKRFSKTLGGATADNPISHWGKGAPRHLTNASRDGTLLKWNKSPLACDTCGDFKPLSLARKGDACHKITCIGHYERRRVFIGSLMDWADEEVPDSWRDALFDQAEKATKLRLLFLTKRGENAHRYLTARYPGGVPYHFWLGMSWMKDRQDDVQWLLKIRARIHWLSVEPLLGLPDLSKVLGEWCTRLCGCEFRAPKSVTTPVCHHGPMRRHPGVDWVIFGGESEDPGGPKARPCNIDHIRAGVRQCREAGVKAFVKQLGSDPRHNYDGEIAGGPIAKQTIRIHNGPLRLKDRKGADPAEWSKDLQVQEVPEVPDL